MKRSGCTVNTRLFKSGTRALRRAGKLTHFRPNARQLSAIGRALVVASSEPTLWGASVQRLVLDVALSRVFAPLWPGENQDPLPDLWERFEAGEGYLHSPNHDEAFLAALERVGAAAHKAAHSV